jgi:hypothetical protein
MLLLQGVCGGLACFEVQDDDNSITTEQLAKL